MAKAKQLMNSNTDHPTKMIGIWDQSIDSTEIATQQGLGRISYLAGSVVLATEPDGSGPAYYPWGMSTGPESMQQMKQIQNLRKHTSDPGNRTWTADEFKGV